MWEEVTLFSVNLVDMARFSPKGLTTSLHATILSIETVAIWSSMSAVNREITNITLSTDKELDTFLHNSQELLKFSGLLCGNKNEKDLW